MISKWFHRYCELNLVELTIICKKILPMIKIDYVRELYLDLVWFQKLNTDQVEFIIDRFESAKDEKGIPKLIEKLWRLHSQS